MTHPISHKVIGNYIMVSDLSQIQLQEKAMMNSYVQLGYQLTNNSLTQVSHLSFSN